jgi:hypothetical protein
MFKTIADVRAANRAIDHHFFDRSTMRFFASRIESGLYAGRYFITSEKAGFTSEQRRFTIREVMPSGEVKTADDSFNKFLFIEDARDRCRELAKGSYPWSKAEN